MVFGSSAIRPLYKVWRQQPFFFFLPPFPLPFLLLLLRLRLLLPAPLPPFVPSSFSFSPLPSSPPPPPLSCISFFSSFSLSLSILPRPSFSSRSSISISNPFAIGGRVGRKISTFKLLDCLTSRSPLPLLLKLEVPYGAFRCRRARNVTPLNHYPRR